MSAKTYTRAELDDILVEQNFLPNGVETIEGWLARGDGVAVYQNADFGHPDLGHHQFVSYGSERAQLETDEPPRVLPDIGSAINWRYQLVGVYREQA